MSDKCLGAHLVLVISNPRHISQTNYLSIEYWMIFGVFWKRNIDFLFLIDMSASFFSRHFWELNSICRSEICG